MTKVIPTDQPTSEMIALIIASCHTYMNSRFAVNIIYSTHFHQPFLSITLLVFYQVLSYAPSVSLKLLVGIVCVTQFTVVNVFFNDSLDCTQRQVISAKYVEKGY